jgi:hypothetical protein
MRFVKTIKTHIPGEGAHHYRLVRDESFGALSIRELREEKRTHRLSRGAALSGEVSGYPFPDCSGQSLAQSG